MYSSIYHLRMYFQNFSYILLATIQKFIDYGHYIVI